MRPLGGVSRPPPRPTKGPEPWGAVPEARWRLSRGKTSRGHLRGQYPAPQRGRETCTSLGDGWRKVHLGPSGVHAVGGSPCTAAPVAPPFHDLVGSREPNESWQMFVDSLHLVALLTRRRPASSRYHVAHIVWRSLCRKVAVQGAVAGSSDEDHERPGALQRREFGRGRIPAHAGAWGGTNPFPGTLFVLTHRIADQPATETGCWFIADLDATFAQRSRRWRRRRQPPGTLSGKGDAGACGSPVCQHALRSAVV
jgi:hypothetical protein